MAAANDMQIQSELAAYSSFLEIANDSEPLRPREDFNTQLEVREFKPELYGLLTVGRWHFIKSYLMHFTFWPLTVAVAFAFLSNLAPENLQKFAFYSGSLSIWGFFLQGPCLLVYGVYRSGDLLRKNEAKIEEAKKNHPIAEGIRIGHAREVIEGVPELVEAELEKAIESFADYIAQLPHKFDLNTSFEFRKPHTVVLDTDLPEIGDVVISETKKALKSGEISVKEKKDKEMNREYATGVIGIAFNLAARILNTSPAIQSVVVTGYTQRLDVRTGKIRDHYLYKINFTRDIMSQLNMIGVDPLKCVEQFEASLSMDKTFFLNELDHKESAS